MIVYIYLLCYNEEVLLPQTIAHYKKYLPNCNIIIYDNKSTDNSVSIAKNNNCEIITWDSNNLIDDKKYMDIKNNCWKKLDDNTWVIVGDMDEWLCITEEELEKEDKNGTTILNVEGYNIIGNSNQVNLVDINLHSINRAIKPWIWESKRMCFKKGPIIDINYNGGAHTCNPQGIIKFSSKAYINKHMEYLGIPFIVNKMINRNRRVGKDSLGGHYITDVQKITDNYNNYYKTSVIF
jgi:hypothetical protein